MILYKTNVVKRVGRSEGRLPWAAVREMHR